MSTLSLDVLAPTWNRPLEFAVDVRVRLALIALGDFSLSV